MFPESTLKLGFKEGSKDILVEVSPSNLLQNNQEFRALANCIFLDFLRTFSDEVLIFITPDSYLKIDDIDYQWSQGEVHKCIEDWTTNNEVTNFSEGVAVSRLYAGLISINFSNQVQGSYKN